ncbi:hypothetical protein CONLIGDRAFT_687822 [Coniochaeta ligniaria NRRL 30616]|uniref:Vid27 PH-like domain-containing protein n=1 Tax=Coniochaeta ligniaria NRRL 30616 TaxID=1408157 RepID=A0A1J7J3Q7_9PEZI|nr:hypothetical protein CONLIGDRAFT_687822 [Coniochaeta ligniaria NRRL 30616]
MAGKNGNKSDGRGSPPNCTRGLLRSSGGQPAMIRPERRLMPAEPERERDFSDAPHRSTWDETSVHRPPKVAAHPEAPELLAAENCELHFFDFARGSFVFQDAAGTATVTEVGKWAY